MFLTNEVSILHFITILANLQLQRYLLDAILFLHIVNLPKQLRSRRRQKTRVPAKCNSVVVQQQDHIPPRYVTP